MKKNDLLQFLYKLLNNDKTCIQCTEIWYNVYSFVLATVVCDRMQQLMLRSGNVNTSLQVSSNFHIKHEFSIINAKWCLVHRGIYVLYYNTTVLLKHVLKYWRMNVLRRWVSCPQAPVLALRELKTYEGTALYTLVC